MKLCEKILNELCLFLEHGDWVFYWIFGLLISWKLAHCFFNTIFSNGSWWNVFTSLLTATTCLVRLVELRSTDTPRYTLKFLLIGSIMEYRLWRSVIVCLTKPELMHVLWNIVMINVHFSSSNFVLYAINCTN